MTWLWGFATVWLYKVGLLVSGLLVSGLRAPLFEGLQGLGFRAWRLRVGLRGAFWFWFRPAPRILTSLKPKDQNPTISNT